MYFEWIIFFTKNEYLQIADNLSIYVCKLLNNVRGHVELEIVLNKTGKETEHKESRLARLDLAIKYQEKPVCYSFIFIYIFIYIVYSWYS